MNQPLTLTDPSGLSWLSKLFHSIGNFLKTYWKPILAIVIAIISYGYLAPYLSQYFAAACLAPGVITTTGAIAAGAISGALAGGIMGGWKGALQGAISGAMFGGIEGFYGSSWSLERVALSGAAGGASSSMSGGDFWKGFGYGVVIAGMQWAAVKMRSQMLKQSAGGKEGTHGEMNAGHESDGWIGEDGNLDGASAGGERAKVGQLDPSKVKHGIFGGNQVPGQPGRIFNRIYRVGGAADHIVEAFSGPHDWFSSWTYVSTGAWTGFGRNLAWYLKPIDLVWSGVALVPAAAFVGSQVAPNLAFATQTDD
jgi:hypothetical protein